MSKVAHTPWEVGPHPWPEQIGCCPLTGRPYSIHGTDNYNVAAATTVEIAHLIAAAPEMLEALKSILQIIDDARSDEEFDALTCDAGGIIFGDIATSAVEEARAAISKAEGRQP